MFNNFQYNKTGEIAVKALYAIIIINFFCFFATKAPDYHAIADSVWGAYQNIIAHMQSLGIPMESIKDTIGGTEYLHAKTHGEPKDYLFFTLNSYGLKHFWLWQYVTSMFMHANFSHIIFNMYGLWLFGKLVAPVLGLRKFLTLYFFSGLLGGFIYTLSIYDQPYFVLLGASGAVMGVTIACGMLLPNTQFMMLFFPTPVKAKTLVIVYILLNVFGVGESNVAFLAHLGGALGAYIYLKIIYRRNPYMIWDPFTSLFGKRGLKKKMSQDYRAKNVNNGSNQKKSSAKKYNRFNFENTNISVNANDGYNGSNKNNKYSQREIDYLLNKISEQGVKSLTEEEFQKLKEIRKQVQKNR